MSTRQLPEKPCSISGNFQQRGARPPRQCRHWLIERRYGEIDGGIGWFHVCRTCERVVAKNVRPALDVEDDDPD